MSDKEAFKSGFVTLVGRSNVGKSTLVNRLVGQKVVIMSDKPQTTRNRIHAVLTTDRAQVVFLDTPGFHKPRHKLGQYMVNLAVRTLKEVDLVLFLGEAGPPGTGDRYILEQLRGISTPVMLVLNKIDLVEKTRLLPLIDEYSRLHSFSEVVPVSALKGDNTDRLLDLIVGCLPEGPRYYPDDMVTDKPQRFIMAELVREKVLQLTSQEVPHSVHVEVEEVEKGSGDLVTVRAVIYVEKGSQKGIIIGKQGRMLKEIGSRAREEMELLFGSRIFLDLWVKVKDDWRNDARYLRTFGFIDE